MLIKIVPPEERTQFSEGFEPMRSLLIATAICAAVVSLTGCTFTVSGPCNSFTHQARIKACGCNGNVACNTCETAETTQEPAAEEDAAACDPCAQPRKVGLLRNMFPCKTDACEETACEEEACEEEVCEDDSCGGKGIAIPRVGKNLMNKLGSMDLMKSKCGCETDACGCEETAEEAKPAPAIADCGCKSGACDTGCRGARVGILDRVTACKDNSCASDCEAAEGEGCDDGCSNGLLGRMNGISVPGSRLAGMMQGGIMQTAMNQQVPIVDAAGADCCGRFVCGRDGKRCMTCRAKTGMGLGNGMGNGSGIGNGLGMRSHMGCGNGTCGQCSSCLSKFRNGRPYAGQMPHTAPVPGMTGMAPQYVYPYYTTRGPRDFLMANPPTIGY